MFSKLALVATTAFAVLAVATPTPGDNNQCQTGPQQCCNSVQKGDSPAVLKAIGALGVQVPADADVGLTCSPISAIGVAGNSCSQQPVCCNGNNFNGVVVVGCTPINVNL